MAANSPASRLAPPTSAPSTSGWAMIPATLSALTDPPYRTRTWSARSPLYSSASRVRIARADLLGVLRAWPPRRCRSPRPARRRRPRVRACSAATPASARVELGRGSARRARPPGAPRAPRRRTGSASGRAGSAAVHLGVDDRVGLAVVLAALGVPDDDVACSRAWPASRRRRRRCRRPRRAARGPARRSASRSRSPSTSVCTERRSRERRQDRHLDRLVVRRRSARTRASGSGRWPRGG